MSFGQTQPAIYQHLGEVPDLYFSWTVDSWRGDPRDTAGSVLRDQQGQPVERFRAIHTGLLAAVAPPSPQDRELFEQRGVSVSATLWFKQLSPGGPLPDVRHQDRITYRGWPGGPDPGTRYWEVLTSQDVGEAGRLLEVKVSERREGAG
jgi:hypothetical protein